jgi:Uma2 family endonuclease
MTASPQLKKDQRYTYADYLAWPDDERCELIDGVAYSMSPAPGSRHQDVSRELLVILAQHLKGKSCRVYDAPFDVRLPEKNNTSDNYIETVVQPDIIVVCDRSKLDDKGCKGAPDLVVEILSPSTGGKDLTVKYDLYERHGVKEYWIIHPIEMTLFVYHLNESGFYGIPDRYASDDKVPVPLLGELVIDLIDVFAD